MLTSFKNNPDRAGDEMSKRIAEHDGLAIFRGVRFLLWIEMQPNVSYDQWPVLILAKYSACVRNNHQMTIQRAIFQANSVKPLLPKITYSKFE